MMQPTNWHVITGAPCSGKTAVIEALEALGYQIVNEVARAFIDKELKKGKNLEEIRSDELAFENNILRRKCAIEASLAQDETLFLDRAIPDSIAYFKLAGLDTALPEKNSRIFRYRTIFLFDRLGFEKDRVRVENNDKAASLQRELENSYKTLGYDIIRVPSLSVRQRTDFILTTTGLPLPDPRQLPS